MTNYLSEAFKELDILNEDVFDLDKDGLEDLRDFQDEDEEEVIDVIDPEAETEEELEDSYIGKVILDCSVCHTDIYKDKEDVIIDEETELANVGEECPYCFSIDGFKVIGEVKPFVETEFETEDDVEVKVDGEEVEDEDEDEEEKNESLKRKQRMVEAVSKRRNRKSLTEAPIYGLEPRYDARKSFYGKAQVDTGDSNDKNRLYSYGTLVAEIKDGKPVVYGTYSQTTLRHIKDWLKQNGFRADTSKQILADYGVKDEACSGRKSKKSVKESRKVRNISKNSLKEDWDVDSLANEIKDAVEWLKENQEGCSTIKLDNRLAVCVGWLDGYNPNNNSVIHAEDDPTWAINAGIKVWTSDSMRTDFGYINAPYDADTGDVWDTDVSISPDEDYASLVSYFEKEYDKMKEYEIEKDGKIVGKWDEDEDEEELESLNRKPRKSMKESVGQDVSEYQKWVDYDMKKYKKISKETMSKIKKAGLSVVKDQYGDYEVIADRKDESCGKKKSRKMKESIEDITIDTGDQEISVSAKDKEEVKSEDEMIAPLSDEVKTDIEMNNEETEKDDEVDVDMDEFSEEEFDELGESYLKKVYENVDNYKTTSVSESNNKIKVEGLIKFTSGKTKKTSFVFEAKTIDKDGHAKFLGENLQISRGHKSFKLSGKISDNKFIAESLNYNYRAKNGNSSQRVYGTVKVSKK